MAFGRPVFPNRVNSKMLWFLHQVMRIVDNVRPDRQTVMFSATFPRAMEALARRILAKPIEVQVGGRSVVCSDVEQHVVNHLLFISIEFIYEAYLFFWGGCFVWILSYSHRHQRVFPVNMSKCYYNSGLLLVILYVV